MEVSAISVDSAGQGVYRDWEESLTPKDCRTEFEVRVLLNKKMDADEKVVRRELVKVWTKIMEKYARQGAPIPSVEDIRRELLNVGVDAAVSAVVEAHWFVFSWMIEDRIREKVERGLHKFDLADLIDDVRLAQANPGMVASLREKIKHHVLFEDF